jgi:LacI family transcriptional regulator
MAKISDVASLAGVSTAAVSRILSGDAKLRVTDETRERVLAAARELRYVPNNAARSLRTARTRTIALVVPDVTSAVYAELARGAEDEAEARGYALVLGRAERLEGDRDGLHRLIAEGRVDGVILQLPDGASLSTLDDLVGRDTPIVVINSVDEGSHSTIVLDDEAGIRTAFDHLRSLGHTAIGYVGGTAANSTALRRLAAYRAAMAEAGLAVNEEWVTALGYTGDEGRAAVAALVTGPMPSALVVANLNAGLGVLAEIHERGLRVPTDISIIAMHDVWYADATWPPITTVRMPLRELGAAAVARVLADDGAATHDVITAPVPELRLRASTADA